MLSTVNSEHVCTLDLIKLSGNPPLIQLNPKGICAETKRFKLGSFTGYFKFYINGSKSNDDGYSSLYFHILKKKSANDVNNLKIKVSYKLTGNKTRIVGRLADNYYPIDKYYAGWGKKSFVLTNTIPKYYSSCEANVKTTTSSIFYNIPKKLELLRDKYKKMYEMSKNDGDITLVIKINNDDDNLVLNNEPPAKKRKLNNNNNNNNNVDDDDDDDDIKEQTMKASSIVLRSSSNVFDRILRNNMIEKESKKIIVNAKSVDDVDDMIYFNITSTLRADCNPLTLIHLAHYYQMKVLFGECINKLLMDLDIYSLSDTIAVFDRFEIRSQYSMLIDFAKKNIKELKKTKEFKKLSHTFRCFLKTL